MPTRLTLVPIGPVKADLLAWLKEQLPPHLDVTVTVGASIPRPTDGYDAQRGQYLGPALIAALQARDYPEAERVMGLIDADCTAPGLNFIFGQATIQGREAVVALPRLRPSFYGRPADPERFRERVLKEIVHELGHTWGLDHCPDAGCVMHFSNTLGDTDVKRANFCPRCQNKLKGEQR